MKKTLIILVSAALALGSMKARADEGMWLLPYLQKMNAADMQEKGLKIDLDKIYNEQGTALKDAIVIFGNGCTGEVVSPDGLLFTNHHCGYGNIQSLSSVEHDYLKNGFWAMNRAEELPAPGLSVRFIRRIIDLTAEVVPEKYRDEVDFRKQAQANLKKAEERLAAEYPDKSVIVRDFFGGNQFFGFVIEEFKDIRLVGAPPTSIGKFGADTDNWMWPRHTGDFSVFRIYSDKDGNPAEYSKDNVPYKSPAHLKVSLRGYEEGDFAMIMGFPGTTYRYMTSWEIDQTLNSSNPTRIYVRGIRQDILKEDMLASDEVRIKYAAKYASSSNYWKNSIGMSRGLVRLNVKADKEAIEERFAEWAAASPDRKEYEFALRMIKEAIEEMAPKQEIVQYLNETVIRATEIASASMIANGFREDNKYVAAPSAEDLETARIRAQKFYKDYNTSTDLKVAKAMLRILKDRLPADQLPDVFPSVIDARFGGDTDVYVDYLFANSVFADAARFEAFLENYDAETLTNDPAVVLLASVRERAAQLQKETALYNVQYKDGKRLFIKGLMEMEPGKMHYPDANFTIRLTYGNIKPYKPRDAVYYDYFTTLTGVMEKEDPTNPEFVVDPRLKALYEAKDFGRYGSDGNINVGFISNNDITGGNSGSPVLNARGELIGLAFDGNWEAMSGDIAFEPDLQRCINVDVRYVLFVIDKFAGAGYLLDEMTIVK